MELLVEKLGADVSVKDINGRSIIHHITKSYNLNDKTACQLLIKLSTMTNIQHLVNDQDEEGKTPLHCATQNNKSLTVELLVEKLGVENFYLKLAK